MLDGSKHMGHYFHLDSSEGHHTEYCLSFISRLVIGRNMTEFKLPKKATQQKEDWECGHIVLINIRMLLEFECNQAHLFDESLSRHIRNNMLSYSFRNIKNFATYIKDNLPL